MKLPNFPLTIILLDRVLAHYGPETKEARMLLAQTAGGMLDRIWPESRTGNAELKPSGGGGERFYDKIQELSPQNAISSLLHSVGKHAKLGGG